MSNWHTKEAEIVVQELGSDIHQGLKSAEVAARIEKYGTNELVEKGTKSPWQILLSQFAQTMVLILIVAAAVSAYFREYTDAVVVIVVVVLNAFLGFRQEYQAEQAMAALKKLAVPIVRVRRDGHVREIPSRELVPGDIVMLEAGNLVPADGHLVEAINLRVQEAALTGESEPVDKNIKPVAGEKVALADRHNSVYMGTIVTYGRGLALITSTGMQTELGSIAELMQSSGQEPTPLQKRLDSLGKMLALAAIGLVFIVVLSGYLNRPEAGIKELFLTGVSMAVAAIPEGLTAVVTIALALGARRMLKRKALIRKLPAVEALGSVTVICSDKTGTLTENRMTVTVLDVAQHRIDLTEHEIRYSLGRVAINARQAPSSEQIETLGKHPSLALLLSGGALANDALIEFDETPERMVIVGDPTEGALVVAAARLGLNKEMLEQTMPRVGEVPFDSDRKRMSTIHKMPASVEDIPEELRPVWQWENWVGKAPYIVFTKGAIDGLLTVSESVWVENQNEVMNDDWRGRIENANADLASSGNRVLGVALRWLNELPEVINEKTVEKDLVFVGMTGMIDPARPEVKEAVKICREAGIRPMMITGDHPLTARKIADELGISIDGDVLTGQALEHMSAEELEKTVATKSVFARVSPEHKLRIVQSLQNQGHIAAMTGDGVNDAPALKKADIGVAMGITGTDVSKEASDMVLLDDNFATIVAAVEEGRVIYDNIRKFIKYTMTSNVGEIWAMLLSPFLGMPFALLPLQILWINLVTDGLPGLALSVENAEPDTMKRPPYPPNENVFARGIGRDILFIGFLMGVLALGIGYIYWLQDPDSRVWQTMIFSTITLSEMGYVMAIRSSRYSLFQIGLFSNRSMIGAVGLTILLQLAVIYVPFLQNIFETTALAPLDLAVCFGVAVLLFVIVEITKWIDRRRNP